MASEPFLILLRAALFAGVAIAIMLVLRAPLRRWFGAGLPYQAWLTVPFVMAASLLPRQSAPPVLAVQALRPVRALAAQAMPAPAPAQADFLLILWACGVAASALGFLLGHRAFLRQAGPLTRCGALYVSAAGAGPASSGLLRPRIIVPHDFAERYSPIEQGLVVAHEQVHVARRDALANLLAAVLQCVFWFNPLVYIGARRFRQDQELACDAAVMRRHPRRRRDYAEALLKSHTGASTAAGIHCHWQSHHPTKERIMSLQQTPPGNLRRLAGRCTLALLALGACGATLGVRAEGPASAPAYAVAMKLDADGAQSAPRVLARAGEKFAVASNGWRIEMTVRQANTPGEVWLTGRLFKGAEVISAPTLLARVGEAATIKVGDSSHAFTLSMTVSPQA